MLQTMALTHPGDSYFVCTIMETSVIYLMHCFDPLYTNTKGDFHPKKMHFGLDKQIEVYLKMYLRCLRSFGVSLALIYGNPGDLEVK